MKKFSTLLIFLIICSFSTDAKGTLTFRVQVGSYKRADIPKNIKQIKDLKKYLLPNGYSCYFKGGYYKYFEGANRALAELKSKGYEKALIRVYRDEKLLSYKNAKSIVMMETYNPTPIPANEKIDKQSYSIEQKKTFGNRIGFYKEILKPEEYIPGIDTALEIKELPEEIAEEEKFKISSLWKRKKKDNSEEQEVAITEEEADTVEIDPEIIAAVKEAVVEEKAEEIIEENDDEIILPENFRVDDIPFFKIYLASTKKGKPIPTAVEYAPDIVYTYIKRDMVLYAVGYFKNSADAQADLARYVDKGFYNAKIIAIYKTIVVSQRMGDEILSRVKN